MGWRRGELWLDTDLLWFRERAGAPAVSGFAAAAIPVLAPPPGLAASRLRRATWKQRRHARRARAAALALAPAVMFVLAALRSGGDQGSTLVAEDPPSLTLRLGAPTVEDAAGPVGPLDLEAGREGVGLVFGPLTVAEPKRAQPRVDGVARGPRPAARPKRSKARGHAFPKIEWHHATSVGLPWAGSLIGGTQLPLEGPSWVTWNPINRSVPNAPQRLYGNEHTIRAVVWVIDAYRAANPEAPRVVVGDISREGGGPMTDEHVSHQNGLDVDVYYPRLDGTPRPPLAPQQVDRRLAQDLLDRFIAAGARMIFVGYSTGLHGPAGVVIPYPHHENHMHVRFPRPGG
jgi:Penicillin-insensitive murein endopeptidase